MLKTMHTDLKIHIINFSSNYSKTKKDGVLLIRIVKYNVSSVGHVSI